MRIDTVNYTVYQYSELTEEAQERARHDAACDSGYSWSGEAIDSLTALAEHFGCRLTDYQVDWFDGAPSSATFDCESAQWQLDDDENAESELAEMVAELGEFNPDTLRGIGECVLTGVCYDEFAIDGLREAYIGGERDLSQLLQSAFDSWLTACQADCADEYSHETFAETADANDWEFHGDGRLY